MRWPSVSGGGMGRDGMKLGFFDDFVTFLEILLCASFFCSMCFWGDVVQKKKSSVRMIWSPSQGELAWLGRPENTDAVYRKRPNRQDIFIPGQGQGGHSHGFCQCKHRSSTIEVTLRNSVKLCPIFSDAPKSRSPVVSFPSCLFPLLKWWSNLDISWNGGFLKRVVPPFGYINFHRMLEWILN